MTSVDQAADTAPPLLRIRGLTKTFPGTRALDDVSFDLERGSVHALVGQNGSGKSTLIKVLAGYHRPDPGSVVELDGAPIDLGDTADSRAAGFRFVHQDLGLVDTLSTVENLALGRGYATGRLGRIRWADETRRAEAMIRELGYAFDVRVPVAQLAAAERTGVAIARALDHVDDARVLVVDEPTATLPRSEVSILLETIRRVRDRGLGVIYVSHRLDEVFAVCDRVTILRDGRRIAERATADLDEQGLVSAMLEGAALEPPPPRPESPSSEVVLDVAGLRGPTVHGVDLRVRRGEITGIAGLTGSGRDAVLGLIFGSARDAGRVSVDGTDVGSDPAALIALGVGYVPADRHRHGAILEMTVRENVVLADLRRHASRGGVLRRTTERDEIAGWIRSLDVRPPRAEVRLSTFSGGNQQKIVLAKWLRLPPRVLLLDEPTQGVDVQAKAMIHALIREAAAQGTAVVIASGDDGELVDTCDRVLTMNDGRIGREIVGSELSVEALGRAQLRDSAAA